MSATEPIFEIILDPEPSSKAETTVVMGQIDQRVAVVLRPSISADIVATHRILRRMDAFSNR
jgi:hypothetical protein